MGGRLKPAPKLARLIKDISPKTVFEPFCGAAAISCHFEFENCHLNDINPGLINFYRHVLKGYVIDKKDYSVTSGFYYQARRKLNDALLSGRGLDDISAGLFWYLVSHSFNGLVRMNKSGRYNMPIGDKVKLVNPHGFEQFSKIANEWTITEKCYLETSIRDYELCFIDPPYLDTFTAYSSQKSAAFKTIEDQMVTLDWMTQSNAGVIIATNTYNAELVRVYQSLGFKVFGIMMPRNISRKASSRGPVKEMIAVSGLGKGKHLKRLIEGSIAL